MRLIAIVFCLASFCLAARVMALRLSRPGSVVSAVHELDHRNGNQTYNSTAWPGVPTPQTPLDVWVFQEIIHETGPAVIVETGTY